jgi:hypothetical protein
VEVDVDPELSVVVSSDVVDEVVVGSGLVPVGTGPASFAPPPQPASTSVEARTAVKAFLMP